jgi:hypothetical protein
MKKLLLSTITILFGITMSAQNTAIPDANFEFRLIWIGLDTGPVNGFVPTANIDTVTVLKNLERQYK